VNDITFTAFMLFADGERVLCFCPAIYTAWDDAIRGNVTIIDSTPSER